MPRWHWGLCTSWRLLRSSPSWHYSYKVYSIYFLRIRSESISIEDSECTLYSIVATRDIITDLARSADKKNSFSNLSLQLRLAVHWIWIDRSTTGVPIQTPPDSKMAYAKELELACQTVQRATHLTKTLLTAVDKGTLDKTDSTPVTIADFAAQALIIHTIHGVYPHDSFVGEEDSHALRSNPTLLDRTWDLLCTVPEGHRPATKDEMMRRIDLGAQGTCSPDTRAWVLDPVDGTATFMNGQQYAVCLSLVENGHQRVGVLGGPNLCLDDGSGQIREDVVDRDGYGYMLFAVEGEGAYQRKMTAPRDQDGERLLPATKLPPVKQITDPADIRFIDSSCATSSNYEVHARVAETLGAPWPPHADLWAAQLRYVAIAAGGCNVLLKVPRQPTYRSKIWDHSGGMLLAQELGVRVTDLEGHAVDCGLGRTLAGCYGMVVAPDPVHGRVVQAVKDVVQSL